MKFISLLPMHISIYFYQDGISMQAIIQLMLIINKQKLFYTLFLFELC